MPTNQWVRWKPIKKIESISADFAYADILYSDELRAGTRTDLGRKWGPSGHRPASPVKIGYQSVYPYLALCVLTGKGFDAFLPKLNGAFFCGLSSKSMVS